MALAAVELDDPARYGRVVTADDGGVERIVEYKDATPDERDNPFINAGLYAFDAAWLRAALKKLTPSAATGELYLTQLVEIAVSEGASVVAVEPPDDSDWESELAGINDRSDLAEVQIMLQFAIVQRHMEEGVTFHDPASCDRRSDGADRPGRDRGAGRHPARRDDHRPRLGDQGRQPDLRFDYRRKVGRVVERRRELEASGNDVRIGPFAHLRAGCEIGDGAEIGNFAEQKKVRFGARSKQHHFSYLGDADIGEDVNIGAGTITANYDGRRSTARSSAMARSSAATRSCARRSRWGRARTRAPAPS